LANLARLRWLGVAFCVLAGNENTVFISSDRKHCGISRVVVPISAPNDVMTEGLKLSFCASPHARVKQQFHADCFSMTNGSMRSCPTSLRVATHNWLTPEYIGVHSNSSEQIGFSHSAIMIAYSGAES
jgi:hypothetical protein